MSKNKILRIVIAAILIVAATGLLVFYLWDIITNNTPITKNLFKMLAALFACLGGLVRLFKGNGRGRSLSFYEKQFAEQIKDAFSDSPNLRKKLLYAIKLYNESSDNRLDKAVKCFIELKPNCKSGDDFYAVNLFLALALTDTGLKTEAVEVYKELINMNLATTTVYGNLGSLHSSLGNFDDAVANCRLSIQNDEKNPAPYQNLAKLYFDNYDFESSKKYALDALNINHKFRQAASLLAVIYTMEGDTANAEKYSHIAISGGEHPERLKMAIEHYMTTMEGSKKDTEDADA